MSRGGRRINVSVTVSPIRDAEGRIAAAAAIPERNTLRHVQVDGHGRRQIEEMREALSRIQTIVAQMRRVTRIELTEDAARSLQVEHLRRMRSLLRP